MSAAEQKIPHPGMGFPQFVVLMAALMALSAFGIDGMLPALPELARGYQVTRANDQQLVVTLYLLSFGVAQLFFGPMMDRYGRKPVLLWGLGFYALFSLMAAVAPTFHLLLVARCLQGVAVATTRVAPVSIIRDSYSGRKMAQVMSLCMLVFMTVPILAPTLGLGVMMVASWRWIFGVLAIATAAVAVWAAVKLPETLKPEDRRPINLAQVADSFRIVVGSRLGMGYTLAMAVLFGSLFGFINSAPQLFSEAFHAPQLFPIVFATTAGSMAASSLVNARIVNRLGMRLISHSALLGFTALAAVHCAVALGGHETVLSFAILQAMTMFCFGMISGNFSSMAMEPLGHVAGAAASAQGFITMVGGSITGFLIGQMFDGTAVPITVGFTLCGLLCLGVVLVVEKGRLFVARSAPAGTATPPPAVH